jgi:hypothetical protein
MSGRGRKRRKIGCETDGIDNIHSGVGLEEYGCLFFYTDFYATDVHNCDLARVTTKRMMMMMMIINRPDFANMLYDVSSHLVRRR